jgi:hypothetical protein
MPGSTATACVSTRRSMKRQRPEWTRRTENARSCVAPRRLRPRAAHPITHPDAYLLHSTLARVHAFSSPESWVGCHPLRLTVSVLFQRLPSAHYCDYCIKNRNLTIRFRCKYLKRGSGRRDSNPRRPAWEVTRHFNFRHLESAGVGFGLVP